MPPTREYVEEVAGASLGEVIGTMEETPGANALIRRFVELHVTGA